MFSVRVPVSIGLNKKYLGTYLFVDCRNNYCATVWQLNSRYNIDKKKISVVENGVIKKENAHR